MKRIQRSRILAVESLENRHLLSVDGLQSDGELFDPSAFEQEMLSRIEALPSE